VGCNFFRWCFQESVDEINVVIIRQRKRIISESLEENISVINSWDVVSGFSEHIVSDL